MTVGQRIQQYRKEKKLSQEELAQMLFVSRQTISLWEKDQTLPSIDNLIRLKEIFGMSIDEILTGSPLPTDAVVENPPSKPNETYSFRFTPEEMKTFSRTFLLRRFRPILIRRFLLLLIISAIAWASDVGPVFASILTGILTVLNVLAYVGLGRSIRLHRKANERIVRTCYSYQVWEDRIFLTIQRENEPDEFHTIRFSEIKQCYETDALYAFDFNNKLLLLRKNDLLGDSAIPSTLSGKIRKRWVSVPNRKARALSIALFVLTIASIWLALIVVNFFSEATNGLMAEFMWIFYLYLPLPISSIVVGIILRKRGVKALKNIIAGIIMSILLIIYGSFTFIFSDIGFDLSSIETRVDIDLPEPQMTSIVSWSSSRMIGGETESSYIVDLHFSDADSHTIVEQVDDDERWMSTLPAAFFDLLDKDTAVSSADYFLIYNADLQTYNTLPEKSGDYRFIILLFDPDSNIVQVAEYTVSYTAP